ncbi:hypothetical protein GOP47_0027011 [Adiantum capillus-veneris]|nr:hypothetical protein GOP47_0027011 [Adiantum capillus-veneris]
MQRDDVSPNAVTFVCIMKACGLTRAIIKGQEIHAHISRHALLQKNLVIGNSLVDMYAKWGLITKSREVFDKLSVRDVNSWNAMIPGYAKLEHGEHAMKCLEKMQHCDVVPDAVTYALSLKACGSMGNAIKGKDIHSEIERRGPTVKNLVVSTALVDMYANCGWLIHAQEVFDDLLTRDLVSWNALITGYVDHECGREALNCLEKMHREKISPNSVTYACCLKACGILRMSEKGCDLYAEISRKGLPNSDNLLGFALVDMYAKCGLVMLAQEVFDKLLVRDLVPWTALIMGYNDIGFGEEALMCLEQMQLEGTFPDGVLLACSLKACGSIGAAQQGKSLHTKFVETAFFEKDPVAGSALVDIYANCGLLKEAQMAFSCLVRRDLVLWNTLIAGYTKYERRKEVLNCVEEMRLEGIQPRCNHITLQFESFF